MEIEQKFNISRFEVKRQKKLIIKNLGYFLTKHFPAVKEIKGLKRQFTFLSENFQSFKII